MGEEIVTLVARVGQQAAAVVLDQLANEREENERRSDRRIELVWSGPEREGSGSRETAAVVRQMFSEAQRFVLVSGYAVYDGASILETLAERWSATPSLTCWMCLNIQRSNGDNRSADEIVREYADRFFHRHWPWRPKPSLYYDPRALANDASHRSVLHAKCVVVDDVLSLVTSANLTEAAYYRNIECGVLVDDPVFETQLANQFRGLVENRQLLLVAG